MAHRTMRRRNEDVVRQRSLERCGLGSWESSVSRRSSVVAVAGSGMHSVLGRSRPANVVIRTFMGGDAIFTFDNASVWFSFESVS
jgi:hypothetical protein